MVQGTAVRAFAAMLKALYERAGSPTLAALVRQGGLRQPPVVLSRSSLSDWLAGRSVPSQQPVVQFYQPTDLCIGVTGEPGESVGRGMAVPGQRVHLVVREALLDDRG